MERAKLKELIQGPIATIPTAFDGRLQLDLGRMAELGRWWVDAGLVAGTSVIKVAAAMGEGPDQDYDEMRNFSSSINVIDNSLQPVRCHKNGGRGYINHTAHAFPSHELRIWELLEAGQYAAAQGLWDRVNVPIARFIEESGRRSGGYRVSKAMMALMGQPVGEPRPPTLPLNEAESAAARTPRTEWLAGARPASAGGRDSRGGLERGARVRRMESGRGVRRWSHPSN